MYTRRYFEAVAIAVSILIGIAFAILSFFGLLTIGTAGPIFALVLGAFALLVLTLGATSLLRQNECFDRCISQRGRLLLIAALLLVIIAALTLLLILTNQTIILILVFLLYTLVSLTLIALYGFLNCLIEAGAENKQ